MGKKKKKTMELKPTKYNNGQNNFNFYIILALLPDKI